jgi:hypothetical protein
MTPKEKAQELVSKFKELPQEGTLMFYLAFEISKQCALIAVDEILLITRESYDIDHINWWQEVKQEIEKL